VYAIKAHIIYSDAEPWAEAPSYVLRQFWRPRQMMDGHYDVIDIICFIPLFVSVEKPQPEVVVVCYRIIFQLLNRW
jgi:hypothetical protein